MKIDHGDEGGEMALRDDTKGGLRKLLLPAAASLAGAGAGLALTRTERLRDALPTLDDVGIGDLADDLRTKLNSVVGKVDSVAGGARKRRCGRGRQGEDSGPQVRQGALALDGRLVRNLDCRLRLRRRSRRRAPRSGCGGCRGHGSRTARTRWPGGGREQVAGAGIPRDAAG